MAMFAIGIPIAIAGLPIETLLTPIPLHRKCRKCGQPFLGRKKLPPDFDECPQCAYNLTGNTSGRSPECGWNLTRRFRAHRKRVDRNDETGRSESS